MSGVRTENYTKRKSAKNSLPLFLAMTMEIRNTVLSRELMYIIAVVWAMDSLVWWCCLQGFLRIFSEITYVGKEMWNGARLSG
jgi:hypothetical protein